MRRPILILLVTALGTSLANAQNQTLTGIERVSLLVDGRAQDSTACDMSEDVVRRVVTSAFEEGGITVSLDSEPVVASISVSAATAGSPRRCASDYEIHLMARIEVAPSAAEEPIAGLLSLWSETRTVASDSPGHLERLAAGLSGLVRDLANEIRLANQPLPTASGVQRPMPQPVNNDAYRIARCRELLSSPRLIPPDTRLRDLDALKCQELVVTPE